jgi:hypothetical protein
MAPSVTGLSGLNAMLIVESAGEAWALHIDSATNTQAAKNCSIPFLIIVSPPLALTGDFPAEITDLIQNG